MKASIRSIASAVAFTAAFAVTSPSFAAGYDFGNPSEENSATRVISINPDTKWVNVDRDETVKIVNASSGQSFVWKFDTAAMTFDLAAVAPAEVLNGRHIAAYIAQHNDAGD